MKISAAVKHLLITAAWLAGMASVAGVVAFNVGRQPAVDAAMQARDPLAWLRADFRLSEGQFVAIRKLHESYSVECEEHCRAIQEAAAAANGLKAASQPDARRVAAADRWVQELRAACEAAITAHVRQVAAEMAPEEGRRYLALVLPKIANFDHQAAPDVGLSAHRH